MYSYKHRNTLKHDKTKTSCTVVAVSALLSNSKNETAAKGSNKIMTKYILNFWGSLAEIESSNFYGKISLTGFAYAE